MYDKDILVGNSTSDDEEQTTVADKKEDIQDSKLKF